MLTAITTTTIAAAAAAASHHLLMPSPPPFPATFPALPLLPLCLSCLQVAGQGNFGSLDDDPPAAMRYTECRLSRVAEDLLLADLDDDTVDFGPTFDASGVRITHQTPARHKTHTHTAAAVAAASAASCAICQVAGQLSAAEHWPPSS